MNMAKEDKKQEEEVLNEQETQETKENGQTDNSEDSDADNSTVEEEETNSVEQELAEMKDKYLRLFSEFDNYRKRTAKERIELMGTATEGLMKALVPVIDDFERGMDQMQKADDVKSVNEGVELIFNKFKGILESKGLKPMESSVGQDLNPEIHEAITKAPAPEEKLKGKVMDEIEKGYYLNEKIIRYAKVVIGS